jgi:hypothetical protein
MNVLVRDPANGRRLVSTADGDITLRGFHHRDEECDIVVNLNYVKEPGTRLLMILTAFDAVTGASLGHVVRYWKRGGTFAEAWAELRRTVKVTSGGVDIGSPPNAAAG